ncbi:RelA/SpoT domain-containing protein [Pseudomonas sp. Snoq117.2]|uniref:RelA/SpoT domain-containing protein n=1 Tax=Pseudomonas sp. Snoq117.2 TaxID=1500302 RepID=UPI0008B9B8CF|nr:RelA/SpoT domain-containing protein [Pseudomonas sp. Snoq117.2]SEO43901.1 ppGpp synthetase catalytic domain-containing protein (RelA/SpoT-type nucleotidyltranferase) [Pseudomonas sp. Snoq117.2]
MSLDEFLVRNRIEKNVWEAAGVSWEMLLAIREDHIVASKNLEDTAGYFVRSMQAFDGVHSVRWRVKDPEHLLEKIIRKKADPESAARYAELDEYNYYKLITDLVGVRALHLFKQDCLHIHDQIINRWIFHEDPISYIREGDLNELTEQLGAKQIDSKVHPAGYRSIHYVLKSQPGLREILVEVQVRTVFEEAWAEIDHNVRYPNFSKNSQIESVLKIFNRLAGSADELGGFIRSLSAELSQLDDFIDTANQEKNSAIEEMSKLLDQLSAEKEVNQEMSSKVELLQKEMKKLKDANRQGDVLLKTHATDRSIIGDNSFGHEMRKLLREAYLQKHAKGFKSEKD